MSNNWKSGSWTNYPDIHVAQVWEMCNSQQITSNVWLNVQPSNLNQQIKYEQVHTLLQHRFYLIIKPKDTYKHYMDEETWNQIL